MRVESVDDQPIVPIAQGEKKIVRIVSRWEEIFFPFDGVIDEVRVYSRALSESEVQLLYQSGQ